jgi:hypothetical protein
MNTVVVTHHKCGVRWQKIHSYTMCSYTMHKNVIILIGFLCMIPLDFAQLSTSEKVICYSCYDSYQQCDANGVCEIIPPASCSLQNYCMGDTCGFSKYVQQLSRLNFTRRASMHSRYIILTGNHPSFAIYL